MSQNISQARKTAFYAGMAVSAVGALIFLSIFLTLAMNFGNFENFGGQMRSFAIRGIAGVSLVIIGQVIWIVGARGLAGSGLVLNPKQARKDLEPYTRMAGGMLHDALEESNLAEHLGTKRERVVMIKCTSCGTLNEEESKFCQECGTNLGG